MESDDDRPDGSGDGSMASPGEGDAPRPHEADLKLFDGEEIKMRLRPHPLSFMSYYLHGVFMMVFAILFGLLFLSGSWSSFASTINTLVPWLPGNPDAVAALVLWGIFMVVLAALVFRLVDEGAGWYLLLYIALLLGGVALIYFTGWDYRYTLPGYMVLASLLMLSVADVYRRSFRYYITSMRVAIIKRFITHDEIFLRYTKIVDVDVHQGFWARIFGYGTIIPITASGIGTGTDSVTVAGDAVRGNLLERGIDDDRIISTTRTVSTGRARPDECLYGVRDPFGVKALVAELTDALSEDTQLTHIRNLLKEGLARPREGEADPGE